VIVANWKTAMAKLRLELAPLLSVTVIVKRKVPEAVGVPVIGLDGVPLGERARPGGSDPDVTAQVNPAPEPFTAVTFAE
jgi:hypothetical protein